MDKEKIKNLVYNAIEENLDLLHEALSENDSIFLVEIKFSEKNKVNIIIDGDDGVNLKECIRISRHIEHNLDREEEDFSLEVTSPDIAKPLIVKRQYQKNINRTLQVKLIDNLKIEGVLKNVEEDSIFLEWKAREPKPIGKGKITVVKNKTIPFKDILEAKVKLLF